MPCRIAYHPGGMAVWKRSRLPVPAWIHSCVLSVKRNSGGAPLTSSAGKRGATPGASSPRSKSQFRARNAVDQAFTGSWQGRCQPKAEKVWLDRFVNRGDKDIPLDLDLVITSDPAWWLTMGNGRGWSSCAGTGTTRDPRIIGNWYDTGVVLAALVARGADCWTPDCLIARTTVRLVIDNNTGSVVPD